MNDLRQLLIFLRLALGCLLFAVSVLCCVAVVAYLSPIGATFGITLIAAAINFAGACYFWETGLSIDLWKPLWPENKADGEDTELETKKRSSTGIK